MPIEPTETNLYWGYVGKAPMIWKEKLFTSRGQSEELSIVIIQLVEMFIVTNKNFAIPCRGFKFGFKLPMDLGWQKEVELERSKPLRIPSYVNIGMLPLRSRKHQKTMQNILPGHKGDKSTGTVIHCQTWCVRIDIRNYIFPRYMFERFASGSSWYI